MTNVVGGRLGENDFLPRHIRHVRTFFSTSIEFNIFSRLTVLSDRNRERAFFVDFTI